MNADANLRRQGFVTGQMAQEEGVIKFRLQFARRPPLPESAVGHINRWRRRLHDAHLIGKDPRRYGGFGFGNISGRVGPWNALPHLRRFLITGSQTGGEADLGSEHYALVMEAHPDRNLIVAEGPLRPSSESMTHAALYAHDARIRVVMHVHAPVLWRMASVLGLPETGADIQYGSPEMAREVCRLATEMGTQACGVFAMGGHQDGLVAYGATAEEPGEQLLALNARALKLDGRSSPS